MKFGKNRLLLVSLAGLVLTLPMFGAEPTSHDIEADAQKLVTTVWRGGNVEAVKRLLDQGIGVNSHGKAGLTPYLAARLRGDKEMLELLESRGANTKAEMPPREKIADRLFGVIKSNAPGAAVLVARDGKVLFKEGYGLADISQSVPVTPETKFRIGSITKQFTAAGILKLQEEGKLSVEDKLTKYIADYPRGDEVRLRHLLTHTSGIHSYTSKPDFMETVTKPVKTADLIESFKNDPYDFDPGKKWLYDNSGYYLLGYIIEKVSGQEYGEFLRQRFFAPLGMTNTGVHQAGQPLEHEALGYQLEKVDQFTRALNWDMSRAGGAGALYSTVEDLYRWNEAVFSGKVLKEDSLKAAFTPVRTEENKDDSPDSGYGYGWSVSPLRGTQEISHGGGLQGFSSFLMRLPKEKFTVVVLANALPATPGVEPGNLAHQLAEVYLGENLAPRPVLRANKNVSPKSFDAVAGRYDYSAAILTVKRQGDQLFAQLGEQPQFEIFPKSETEFFWKAVDAQVTFVKDATGKVTKAIHRQNGQTINAPRLGDLVEEAKVDPAAYDALVGKYDYAQGKVILTVSRDGDRLFAQMTGQPKFQIFPKSPTEFFWKVVSAQVTFVKDADGKVTRAVHHQGGETIEAPRVAEK